MGESSYIGLAALEAKAMAGLTQGVMLGAEYLAGQQQAAAPVRWGTLKASIHVAEVVTAGYTVRARTATGGEASAYAVFVHEGTSPHEIRATSANALFWPGAAHPVKAVMHPGAAANRFMAEPLIANRALLREFVRRSVAAQF